MADTNRHTYRVLIVDDDAYLREMLADLLRSPQRSIEVRDTARAALEFLQHNPVDLAFVDLMLQGMRGDELADRIKERNPHAHVIICTGFVTEAAGAQAKEAKVDRVLHKPLNLGEVLRLADSYATE